MEGFRSFQTSTERNREGTNQTNVMRWASPLFNIVSDANLVRICNYIRASDRYPHVTNQAILNRVDPPVNSQFLTVLPSLLDYDCVTNIVSLFDDVEFA